MPFEEYAKYYDVFYKTKTYKKEVDYVFELFAKHSKIKSIKRILDLGCGTGGHILEFAKKGFPIDGVDISEQMIDIARQKIRENEFSKNVTLTISDIVKYESKYKYDLIVSMFAVVGYITVNDGLLKLFRKIKNSLSKDGIFVFDVWYGPTVLNNLPETRIQEFTIGGKKTMKLVRPIMIENENIVKVNYDILTYMNKSKIKSTAESHSMRYVFPTEIDMICSLTGLKLVKFYNFLSFVPPKIGDWNVTFVIKHC